MRGKRAANERDLYGLAWDLMRVSADGKDVQTTKGAIVPLAHVKRVAPLVLRMIRAGRTYTSPPDAPIRLGVYRLDSIDAEGTVCVGCHTFNRAEIERVAGLLHIATESAEAMAVPAGWDSVD